MVIIYLCAPELIFVLGFILLGSFLFKILIATSEKIKVKAKNNTRLKLILRAFEPNRNNEILNFQVYLM